MGAADVAEGPFVSAPAIVFPGWKERDEIKKTARIRIYEWIWQLIRAWAFPPRPLDTIPFVAFLRSRRLENCMPRSERKESQIKKNRRRRRRFWEIDKKRRRRMTFRTAGRGLKPPSPPPPPEKAKAKRLGETKKNPSPFSFPRRICEFGKRRREEGVVSSSSFSSSPRTESV